MHPSHKQDVKKYRVYLFWALVGVLVSIVLQRTDFTAGLAQYASLHTILESFSVVISILIFAIGWSTRHFAKMPNLSVFACLMLIVGLLDFQHALSYPGMPNFITPSNPEKAIQFWLFARVLTGLAILTIAISPWITLPRLNSSMLLIPTIAVTLIISWLILFQLPLLPRTFVEGEGLTPFKVNLEYFIIAFYIVSGSLFFLHLKRVRRSVNAVGLLLVSFLIVVSEYYFTLYEDVTDTYNLFGHLYKCVAYFVLYRSIVVENVLQPYLDLSKSEQRLNHTLSGLPNLIMSCSIDGQVKMVFTKAEEQLMGLLDQNSNLLDVFDDKYRKHIKDGFQRAVTYQQKQTIESAISYQASKQYYELSISAISFQDDTTKLLIVIRNVTQRVKHLNVLAHEAQLKDSLLELKIEAKQLNESEFIQFGLHKLLTLLKCDVVAIVTQYDNELVIRFFDGIEITSESLDDIKLANLKEHETKQSGSQTILVTRLLSEVESPTYIVAKQTSVFAKHFTESFPLWVDVFGREIEKMRQDRQMLMLFEAIEQNPNPILISDLDTNIEYVNKAYCELSGYDKSELKGQKASVLSSGKTSDETYQEMWKSLNAEKPWLGNLINKSKNGVEFVERTSIYPVMDEKGSVYKYISFQTDITKEIETESQIHRLSYYDGLTELPNSKYLRSAFPEIKQELRQNRSVVLMLGIDNFKLVNEVWGASAGDKVLKIIAHRIQKVLHRDSILCRWSGDCFVAVIPKCDAKQASWLSHQLIHESHEPIEHNGNKTRVTLSIGIAQYPEDSQDFETLIQYSESAMFEVKKQGRNNFLFSGQDMRQQASRHLQIMNALNFAVSLNEFSLVYQPQVDINTNQVVGAEVLLRWKNEELGLVSPAEFIPVAESSGAIKQIDQWVFTNAVRQIKQWRSKSKNGLIFAINLSAARFEDKDLVSELLSVLHAEGVPPTVIDLELTEVIALNDPDQAIKTLKSLRQAGFKLSIDDFGTGYSSMSYLKRFSLDKLKIDKSFIDNIESGDTDDIAILKAMIQLAKSLDMETIAEGVENQHQWETLISLGCDQVQGYYFSKPLDEEEFKSNYLVSV